MSLEKSGIKRDVEGVLHSFSDFRISVSVVSLDIILEPNTKTLTVLIGKPASFCCKVTGGDLKNYQMSWYKNEDNSLTLVYKLNSTSTDNLRSNFQGKIDNSKSQFILDIQKATTGDAETYYCESDIHCAEILFLSASDEIRHVQGGMAVDSHCFKKL
jgi:hypothetical protein